MREAYIRHGQGPDSLPSVSRTLLASPETLRFHCTGNDADLWKS